MTRFILFFAFLLPSLIFYAQTDSSSVVVSDIVIEGNKRTKKRFIERETGIAKGDTISRANIDARMEEIRNNVNNLQLFNIVRVTPIILPSNDLLIMIEVTERWYFYPSPILKFAEPNFNIWWKNKDFSRTNYGMAFELENFRGRGEELEVALQLGFSRRAVLKYRIPYISYKSKWGLKFQVAYSENDEFNIGTFNNQRTFFSEGDGDSRNEQAFEINLTNRPNVFSNHTFGVRFKSVSVADSLLFITTDHLANSGTSMRYVGLEYGYSWRKVDRASYPLVGRHIEGYINKEGVGLGLNAPDNWALTITARNYLKVRNRMYFHSMLRLKTIEGAEVPYYLQRGLGYGNESVRGYEFYVMDGQRYGLMRNNVKFELIPWKERTLGFIKSTKFNSFQYALYFNLIADMGYVDDRFYADANPRNNEFLGSLGAGVDLLLSYDVTMRVEAMTNRLNETGIYFHFSRSF